jgi:hypothetical protein
MDEGAKRQRNHIQARPLADDPYAAPLIRDTLTLVELTWSERDPDYVEYPLASL